MIDLSRALELLCGATERLDVVRVGLRDAYGRVLAQAVTADRDFPPTDRSAMDGYAVRAADVDRPGTVLDLVGELPAGRAPGDVEVGPGQAVRIMTGAVVPPGADSVVMVERTSEQPDGTGVRIDEPPRPGQHVRRRGEDLRAGDPVLDAGVVIRAPEVAALASVGLTEVPVVRAPEVHVLATGDEIVEPDCRPADHQVRNSNAWTVLAQLRRLEIDGRYLGIAGDDRSALATLLETGLAGDVLLISGGVSVGAYDLVAAALAEAGMERLFHKVAVKPGKPVLAGRRGRCLVVGLPGNPVSTFAIFAVLVAPALRKMMGRTPWANRFVPARLEEPLRAAPGRETYHLARLSRDARGLTARQLRSTGSGDVLALARANGFLVTGAEGTDLAEGETVQVLPWE